MPNLLTDPAARSALMSKIRSKNTKPEVIVFLELKRRGLTFQRHYDRVPGKPDLAKPRKKLAVFIDGDFWHGREINRVIAKHGRESSWVIKLERTMTRDSEQERELVQSGWSVLRVWESEVTKVSTRSKAIDRIEMFLRSKD